MPRTPVKKFTATATPKTSVKFNLVVGIWAAFLPSCSQSDISPAALTEDQIRARWHNNQGVVYMDQHNYTRGKEEFIRAVALDPQYANGHVNLGISFFSLGKFDSAASALETALGHDPDHLHGLYTRGLLYLNQGRQESYPDALRDFERVTQADPDDPLVRYYIARTKAKLERREEAVADFERTIKLDPTNVSAYYAMAQELQRLGRREEWRAALETFQQLSQAGGEGVSSSYQGQGKYAEAAPDMGETPSPQDDRPVALSFGAPQALPGTSGKPVTTADGDGDGVPELVVVEPSGLASYQLRSGVWEEGEGSSAWPKLPATTRDILLGDADDDGDLDFVLSATSGTYLSLTSATGAGNPAEIAPPSRHAVFGDVDHDGDLDLLLVAPERNRLLQNDGQAAFSDASSLVGLSTSGSSQAMFSDFDNDRDVDFLTVPAAAAGAIELYSNNRDGSFSDNAAQLGLTNIAVADAAVGDFDGDGFVDIVTVGRGAPTTIHRNGKRRAFTPTVTSQVGSQASVVRAGDFDNDGDLDLAVVGDGGLHVLAQAGGQLVPQASPLASDSGSDGLIVQDFDADGRVDLWANGSFYRNQTEGGNWVAIRLAGLNSSPHGIGAKLEVKTRNRQIKRELRGGSGDPHLVHFGVGTADSLEFIRVLWPSGVRQTELACPSNQTLQLTELNRKGTSCPILYAWDGERYRFVSDFLGGAIIGYPVSPGQYKVPDTDEYLLLGPIAPKDGSYSLQITNVLEEIIYLDAAQLVAIDHREGLSILPNERLLTNPPYPEFGVHPISEFLPLRAAVDDRGNDALAALSDIDDVWYDRFGKTDIHGYGEKYTLELDLGDLSAIEHPALALHGWVDYAHSTSNWAAWQRDLELQAPRLYVSDGDGGWILALADMGSPAGLPKEMIVDLSGLFPSDDYRIRITTSATVYWDRIATASVAEASVSVARREVEADLHWRGYPRHTSINGTFAYRYDYDDVEPYTDWGTHEGAFTRFGDVSELLREEDDKFVILLHGDEVTIEVATEAFPTLAPGMERTFLLYADGFGNDMDFHSARSLTVAPLPFHSMSTYPYPSTESYPYEYPGHMEYILNYNTRWIKGYYD